MTKFKLFETGPSETKFIMHYLAGISMPTENEDKTEDTHANVSGKQAF